MKTTVASRMKLGKLMNKVQTKKKLKADKKEPQKGVSPLTHDERVALLEKKVWSKKKATKSKTKGGV